MRSIEVPPNADSLVESLRDIGYTFETALADIIDNSIYAKARNIYLFFQFEQNDSYIAIIDDGISMSEEELINAMRPGSTNPKALRASNDLGRFGLGLKTASFSQCRKATVVTSQKGIRSACQWDLDYIGETGEWSLQVLDQNDISILKCVDKLPETGTLVLWEKPDRIIDNTENTLTESMLYKKIDHARTHLELVFHRFLKGEAGLSKIAIYINNMPLEPFNPFNENNLATQTLAKEEVTLDGETIVIQPYILPYHSKVSATEYEKYAGDGDYLNNQGFYVYRNSRLLISGTWFRLIPKKETTKLARVKIDLPNNLDDLWQIDVKKSMASPPAVIRNRLKKIIERIAGSSARVYTSRGHRTTQADTPFWERFVNKNTISYAINKEHPLISHFTNNLDEEKKAEFTDILNLIQKYFPMDSFFADQADRPQQMAITHDEQADILERAGKYYDLILRPANLSRKEELHIFKTTEPFSLFPDIWDDFLANMERS